MHSQNIDSSTSVTFYLDLASNAQVIKSQIDISQNGTIMHNLRHWTDNSITIIQPTFDVNYMYQLPSARSESYSNHQRERITSSNRQRHIQTKTDRHTHTIAHTHIRNLQKRTHTDIHTDRHIHTFRPLKYKHNNLMRSNSSDSSDSVMSSPKVFLCLLFTSCLLSLHLVSHAIAQFLSARLPHKQTP